MSELAEWVADARRRTFALVADLDDAQLMGPRLSIVNPMLWEIGHVAWFQEHWCLRRDAARARLYDSSKVAHDTRWDLPLPSRAETIRYLEETRDEVLRGLDQADRYFVLLSIFHEDMHDEAFTYTRQTLGYPGRVPARRGATPISGDARVDGGRYTIGSTRDEPFVFDNEKWAHEVTLEPFAIARTAVTQAQFAEFVSDGGYRRRDLWTPEGWQWRERAQAERPVYWSAEGTRRHFDQWLPLEADLPVIHVNWFEADAWCRWAKRRLPTEEEWEVAAAGSRREHANLDAAANGTVSVHAFPEGDSRYGCRQMIGNAWEWTQTDFQPYAGFSADPYEDYSQPWFGSHKVLRGGAWTTRSRMIRVQYRNFYTPDRRDVLAGFRTCAL